jgi:hypothetical protein
MAAVPIQIDGVLWDHALKAGRKVSLIGQSFIYGLSVGGGPIFPPDTTPPDSGLHPEHPIVEPPPDPPEVPPGTPPGSVVKEAPAGGWGYYTDANSALYAAYRPANGQSGPKG